MTGILYYMLCGWHHGKGSKFTREKDYENALEHFKKALTYAVKCKNDGAIPLETECVAHAYLALENYDEALIYAQRCFDLYKRDEMISQLFRNGVVRSENLIEKIRGKIAGEGIELN